jgi:endonuclease YncB( thermonuclease family)
MPRLWFRVFTLCIDFAAFASDITGKVVGIADGDTFTLLLKDNSTVRIRLHGIDTPEKGQPFGNNAKQFTSNLIFDKQVNVTQTDTDRYGRIVGIVTNPENININEALLKAGMAWHYKKYDSNPIRANFEKVARASKIVVCQAAKPIPPWDCRAK